MDVIHVIARLVPTVAVEVAVIQRDGLVLGHRIGDGGSAVADGDLHGAGKDIPGVAPAGVGNRDGAGIILIGNKGHTAQIGVAVIIALGGGGELFLIPTAIV